MIDSRPAGIGFDARRRPAARFLVAAASLFATVALTVTACGPHHQPIRTGSPSRPANSYGSLPSFLPSSSLQPDSVLTGTAARPALTTEGDSVLVVLAAGAALRATVSGPVVPGEGLPVQAPATTCTWTVTLSDATANVAIKVADFTTIDHLGAVYPVALVAGQPAPPAVLTPGQTVSYELRAVMPTGEGLMRWAPGGQRVLASWDFEVEND